MLVKLLILKYFSYQYQLVISLFSEGERLNKFIFYLKIK